MYPLKFTSVFQERIWGGRRLRSVLGKAIPADLAGKPVGESWELADLPPGTLKADSRGGAADGSLSSAIANGPWEGRSLHDVLANDSAGARTAGQRPAQSRPVSAIDQIPGRPDGFIRAGPSQHSLLRQTPWRPPQKRGLVHSSRRAGGENLQRPAAGASRGSSFAAAAKSGQVEPLLCAIKVRPGDCHYLESGTVHALRAGILAAEVQTPSDTTFRVFDWNRLGPDNQPRGCILKRPWRRLRLMAMRRRKTRVIKAPRAARAPHTAPARPRPIAWSPVPTSRWTACSSHQKIRWTFPAASPWSGWWWKARA